MPMQKKNGASRMFDRSYSFQVENYRGASPNLAIRDSGKYENKDSNDSDEASPPERPNSPLRTQKDKDPQPAAEEDLGQQLLHSARKRIEFFWFVSYGVMLTLVAGYMNAVSILVAGIPASHVSGTSSKAGILLGQDQFISFSDTFLMIPTYMFGAFVASQLVTARPYHMSRDYNWVFLVGTLALLTGFLIEVTHDTSATRFGTAYFTAFTCGLQNAASSIYSNNLLRTTHVTGTATDIAILIGRAVQGQNAEYYRLFVFVPLLLAFIIGGAIGAAAYQEYRTYALAGNVIAFGSTGLCYFAYLTFIRRAHHPRRRAASYSTAVDAGGKPVMQHVEPFKFKRQFSEGGIGGDVELGDRTQTKAQAESSPPRGASPGSSPPRGASPGSSPPRGASPTGGEKEGDSRSRSFANPAASAIRPPDTA